jgi:hypothetical protein
VELASPDDEVDIKRRSWLHVIEDIYKKSTDAAAQVQAEPSLIERFAPKVLPLKFSQFVLLNGLGYMAKHGTSVPELITQSDEGDLQAMIKLLTIDPIFIELESVRKQIRMASLFGETAFLEKVSKALIAPRVHKDLSKFSDELYILVTWHFGFAETGVEQFGFFLNESGMKRFGSISSLQRKLNRLGISTK